VYVTSHQDQLCLAIPLCAGTMSIGDGYGYFKERNAKFCLTVDHVVWLTSFIKGAGY